MPGIRDASDASDAPERRETTLALTPQSRRGIDARDTYRLHRKRQGISLPLGNGITSSNRQNAIFFRMKLHSSSDELRLKKVTDPREFVSFRSETTPFGSRRRGKTERNYLIGQ